MTLDPLPPVGCELTDPLARLLFSVALTGVLRTAAPGYVVAPEFRCRMCRSPATRFQVVAMTERGFMFRCIRCLKMSALTLEEVAA